MNWKEEFDKEFADYYDLDLGRIDDGSEVLHYEHLKSFISTQIIEKLIEEMAKELESYDYKIYIEDKLQKLRAKWLKE